MKCFTVYWNSVEEGFPLDDNGSCFVMGKRMRISHHIVLPGTNLVIGVKGHAKKDRVFEARPHYKEQQDQPGPVKNLKLKQPIEGDERALVHASFLLRTRNGCRTDIIPFPLTEEPKTCQFYGPFIPRRLCSHCGSYIDFGGRHCYRVSGRGLKELTQAFSRDRYNQPVLERLIVMEKNSGFAVVQRPYGNGRIRGCRCIYWDGSTLLHGEALPAGYYF